jgi:hypothetical protein
LVAVFDLSNSLVADLAVAVEEDGVTIARCAGALAAARAAAGGATAALPLGAAISMGRNKASLAAAGFAATLAFSCSAGRLASGNVWAARAAAENV